MKLHQKRQAVPKNWPVARKGTTFVVKKTSAGIPLLVVLRDLMELAQNRKEVKKAIHKKDLLICGKPASDEKQSLELLDILTIVPAKKHYKIVLSALGKFDVEEISEKEAKQKVSKVIGKKTVAGKKTQYNLLDGRNYLSEVEAKVNDSVIVDFKKNTITKAIPVKKGSKVLVIGGKHAGYQGSIESLAPEHKLVEVKSEDKTFNALIKHILVLN
jgi:small subunit ribosomal protein S4e